MNKFIEIDNFQINSTEIDFFKKNKKQLEYIIKNFNSNLNSDCFIGSGAECEVYSLEEYFDNLVLKFYDPENREVLAEAHDSKYHFNNLLNTKQDHITLPKPYLRNGDFLIVEDLSKYPNFFEFYLDNIDVLDFENYFNSLIKCCRESKINMDYGDIEAAYKCHGLDLDKFQRIQSCSVFVKDYDFSKKLDREKYQFVVCDFI